MSLSVSTARLSNHGDGRPYPSSPINNAFLYPHRLLLLLILSLLFLIPNSTPQQILCAAKPPYADESRTPLDCVTKFLVFQEFVCYISRYRGSVIGVHTTSLEILCTEESWTPLDGSRSFFFCFKNLFANIPRYRGSVFIQLPTMSNPNTTDIELQHAGVPATVASPSPTAPLASPSPTASTERNAVRRRRRFLLWTGAKPIPLLACIAIGLIFRFAVPKPSRVSHQGWQLLAIFLATIAGLILGPLPIGSWAFACLTLTVVTKTLTFAAAIAGFTNQVIWLVVASFFFSRGFMKSGLGDRIALYFVKVLGKSTLGLAYGLSLSELLICPAVPSTTARAGGVFLPLIKSMAAAADSRPKEASAKKLGAYLVQSQLQCSGNSSAMFLTAAAQNLLCIQLAKSLGVNVQNQWITWFKAASLPALISLSVTPFILFKLFPPEIKETPDAPVLARQKLEQMGPVRRNEWLMIGTMLLTVALWISGQALNMATVVAAMLGLSILLLLGVLDWDDCLSEKTAWDTLIWFGVLVGMASQLTTLGIVSWISDGVAKFLKSLSLGWPASFFILQAAYFSLHYLFASQTAHVAALYSAFLGMQLAAKVPGLFAALALAYNTNLFGALTHYSSGQSVIYCGGGFVKLPDVFRLGIMMALINISIWILVATPWWKILGLY